jgi:hypothetical protein
VRRNAGAMEGNRSNGQSRHLSDENCSNASNSVSAVANNQCQSGQRKVPCVIVASPSACVQQEWNGSEDEGSAIPTCCAISAVSDAIRV